MDKENLYFDEFSSHLPSEESFIPEINLQVYRSTTRSSPVASFKLISMSDPCRIRWDIAIITLALYNCLMIPYRLSFEPSFEFSRALDVMDIGIDILFIFDIYLNFRTSYIDMKTGEEVKKRLQIAQNYIYSGRFVIDVLACIPIDLITLAAGEHSSIQLVKLLKLTRIMRLNKIIYYMRLKEDIKISLRIGKLILFIFIYFHLLACAWNLVVSVDKNWVFPAHNIRENPYLLYESSHFSRYLFCFYVAVSTLVGVELLPVDILTYALCAASIIVGTLLITYVLGEIVVLVFNLNQIKSQFFSTMDSVSTIMKKLKLTRGLQYEITEYFTNTHHLLIRNQEWERFRIVVPPSFIQQINNFLYTDIVQQHWVFKSYPKSIRQVVSKLQYKFLRPADYLIRTGDEAREFYFIVKGHCEVWVEGLDHLDHHVRNLQKGDYCGELGLLYRVRRSASVQASTYSSAGLLPKDTFLEILEDNSQLEEDMRRKISSYKDPQRAGLLRMLQKVAYLNRLDKLTLDRILYSMEVAHFDENTIVFEEGAQAQQIYFLVEGTVTLFTNIYDMDLLKRMATRKSVGSVYSRYRNMKTLSRDKSKRSSIRKILNPHKKAQLKLCKLTDGSVICATQALFRKKLNVYCLTNESTNMLILKTSTLETMAKERLQLRMAINRCKQKYFNRFLGENVLILPEFDCFKEFPLFFPGQKESWKARKRLKNLVLMVIVRNRYNLPLALLSLKAMTQRLKAILEAKERKLPELALMIEKREINHSVVKSAAFLTIEEMTKPILHQFAMLANECTLVNDPFKHRSQKALKKIKKMERRLARIDVRTQEINDTFKLINSFLR